jgi:WD40 repeat protein
VLQLWDTAQSTRLTQFTQHKGCIKGLAFSSVNELLLCSAGTDKLLLFYDIQANKLVKSMACEAPLCSLDFMNDGFTVAVGTATVSH